jgi:aminoglycoside phosphotransferase (APT) family kinase protein
MGFVDGLVPHDAIGAAKLSHDDRHGVGIHVAEILAKLHSLSPESVGLGDLGRKENYLARQLKRWQQQWEQTKTHPVPAMEEAYRLLQARMPAQAHSSIVHGDYRLGNMIVAGGKIRALLDWELCTLGDPLADLGYLLNTWRLPDEVIGGDVEDAFPTTAGGFPTRDELMKVYATLTGFDLSHIDYYRAFAHWRISAIRQGVYKRYQVGAMGEHNFDLDAYRRNIARKAEMAITLLGH